MCGLQYLFSPCVLFYYLMLLIFLKTSLYKILELSSKDILTPVISIGALMHHWALQSAKEKL